MCFGGSRSRSEIMGSVLGTLGWRFLCGTQMEISIRQLAIRLERSREIYRASDVNIFSGIYQC